MGDEEKRAGVLYIVSTPIGNLEDITLRALRVLKEVDFIAAEDTRRTRRLLSHYGIHKPLISYHEHNRRAREETLIRELRQGKNAALVTDAGTPGISDPGEDLVRRALREGIPLVPIPGPSGLITALSVSGLPTGSFLFYGFPPARSAARRKLLLSLKDREETLVFYESPKRLRMFLEDALAVLGDRPVAVAREMTKVHEEFYRGRIAEVLPGLGEEVKGEATVIIAGGERPERTAAADVSAAVDFYLREEGLSLKEAALRVAAELGVSRKEAYRRGLKLKQERGDSPKEDDPPA